MQLVHMAVEPHGLAATWMGKALGPDITSIAISDGSGTNLYMLKFTKKSGLIQVFRQEPDTLLTKPYQDDPTGIPIATWTLIFIGRITTPYVLSSATEQIKEDICNQKSRRS